MKVAFAFAAALILCVALLGPVQARFEKPKYCVGKNGKHYLRGEHYDDKVKGTCIRYTCVRKGKKLKMAKKKVSCAVEPEPSLKANVTALEGKLEALQNSVESILVMMTALQSTSSQLEINMTANIDAININKESIIVNKEGISVHEDSISSNKDGIASNTDNISVNKDSCSAVQTSADKLKTCLGDVTSKECPSSQNGKVAIVDAIIENEDDIEALGSLHDNTGCCTPTTIAEITTTATTTTTTSSPTTTPIGVVGDWSSWSACTATCGNATKTRTRACEIPHCQPFVKEETLKCHLPKCGNSTIFEEERCFFEDTNITFQDLGHNHYGQDHKPKWELSDAGRTLKSALNTRPSAGLSNLGSPSSPVSFSGRVFSTSNDDDVMGMVFGYWNETNFFVVASARDGGPTNWYVGRLHATCGESCASETTISDAIWYPQNHPEDITVLATGSTAWQHNEKYNFTICFNPSKLLFNVNVVNVTVEDEAEPVLQTGILSAKTNDSDVDEISRKGGFIGVYVDSQADTTWDNLDCHDCDLDLKEGPCPSGWTFLATGCYKIVTTSQAVSYEGAMTKCKQENGYLVEFDNQGEQDAIIQFLEENNVNEHVWLGGTDAEKIGKWIGGYTGMEIMKFDGWDSESPSHVGTQHCILTDPSRKFKWNDYWCNLDSQGYNPKAALCEYSSSYTVSGVSMEPSRASRASTLWTDRPQYFIDSLPDQLVGATLFQPKHYVEISTIQVSSAHRARVYVALYEPRDGGLMEVLEQQGWTLEEGWFVHWRGGVGGSSDRLKAIWSRPVEAQQSVIFTTTRNRMTFAIFVSQGSSIRVASGQRLSYLSSERNGRVHLKEHLDDHSGGQKWIFKHLFDDVYNIIVSGGTDTGEKFLSCRADGFVDLWTHDGGDRQKWRILEIGNNTYNIKVFGGTNPGEEFLSCREDGLVDLYSQDGIRQRWKLNLGTYKKMEYSSFCSGSWARITNEATCRSAAAALDLKWANSWNGPGDFPGCLHTKDSRNSVYFNTSPKPSNNPNVNANYAEICQLQAGWTIIQRRGQYGNAEDYFNKDFKDYENGFGSDDGELWIGLKNLADLTKDGEWELQVDLTDWDDKKYHAKYGSFSVGPAPTYKLHIGGFKDGESTLGDSMVYHNGSAFSARDKDQDGSSGTCAVHYKGGWWYNACYMTNLNGLNYAHQKGLGISWRHGKARGNSDETWKASVMKIKRVKV